MSKLKLHLGCGWRNFGDDWIHIDGGVYYHLNEHDIVNYSYTDVDLIYASHVLEYFDRDEADHVLTKWYDSLKPGGILRLAVPDFEKISSLYTDVSVDLDSFIGPIFGKMQMGTEYIYHKTVYDYSSLYYKLQDNNFKDIRKYDWRQTEHANFDDHSQAYIPHMDKENGTLISLNVEATK